MTKQQEAKANLLIVLAGVLIGVGVGLIFGNLFVWSVAGLAVGFLGAYITVRMQKK